MDKKTLIDKISELTMKVGDLEQELCDLEDDLNGEEANSGLYGEDDFEIVVDPDPEYLETLDPYIFLRDIGLDPWNLPSSVGERMDIRKRLESPVPDLSDKLDECQEQYKYIEEHYNRAWELGYDPVTKDFYCRACTRAGRLD